MHILLLGTLLNVATEVVLAHRTISALAIFGSPDKSANGVTPVSCASRSIPMIY